MVINIYHTEHITFYCYWIYLYIYVKENDIFFLAYLFYSLNSIKMRNGQKLRLWPLSWSSEEYCNIFGMDHKRKLQPIGFVKITKLCLYSNFTDLQIRDKHEIFIKTFSRISTSYKIGSIYILLDKHTHSLGIKRKRKPNRRWQKEHPPLPPSKEHSSKSPAVERI